MILYMEGERELLLQIEIRCSHRKTAGDPQKGEDYLHPMGNGSPEIDLYRRLEMGNHNGNPFWEFFGLTKRTSET